MNDLRTLGQLRASDHRPLSVRDELRRNLIAKLRAKEPLFEGIIGFDDTVIPHVVNALLSRHDFILLGLRGQAKSRLLRSLSTLLDETTPVVPGCPLNSHPLDPVGRFACRRVAEEGDDLEIEWLPRKSRYREKLATPDITIADLIGDIDPIKAATRRLDLDDEEVIHYGLVPRTNRGIFAVNEVPDLPTRIQVGLLDILEEKDVQIRGFPVRLPVDVLLVFTANPEDYTNRGSIITPLRDRIESQIHTHYPVTIEEGIRITKQEAWVDRDEIPRIVVPAWFDEIIEETAVRARASSFVDQNSGVSARLTIALAENLVSNAERRALALGIEQSTPRVSDLFAAMPAVSGKIELVYEGEQEGPVAVASAILGQAVKAVFDRVLPDPYGGEGGTSIYDPLTQWFRAGHKVEVGDDTPPELYIEELRRVPDLETLARNFFPLRNEDIEMRAASMELILEGLHQASLLGKEVAAHGARYADAFDEMARELEREG